MHHRHSCVKRYGHSQDPSARYVEMHIVARLCCVGMVLKNSSRPQEKVGTNAGIIFRCLSLLSLLS